jgi:hypothetical protein
MVSRTQALLKPERRQLVHAAMDAYLGWRDQCEAVRGAYERWRAAGESDAEHAFSAYATALDGEEQACDRYAGLIQRASAVSVPEIEPDAARPVTSRQGH